MANGKCVDLLGFFTEPCPHNAGVVWTRAGTSGRFRNGWYYYDRARFEAEGPLYIEERADDVLSIGGAQIRKLGPSRPDKVLLVRELARTVAGKLLRCRLLEFLSEQAE